jgi:ribose transport system ATP-binding protein
MHYFECRKVNKNFGAVVALSDATFSIEKGEIHAILGGNGSGKSTLAKIIGGSVFADSGDFFLEGEPQSIDSPADSMNLGVAVTSQELSLFDHMTVEANLTLLDSNEKFKFLRNPAKARADAMSVLEKVGLTDILETKVGRLSENEKYLIEFAKAIKTKPRILIVDEITSALHRDEVDLIKSILKEMASGGCSIVFISHRLQEIYSISDRITVMRNGQVVNTHSVSEREETLINEMVGDDTSSEIKAGDRMTSAKKMAQSKIMLELNDFTISNYDSPVNLKVKVGEMIGIAGLKGQGQSELLRTIFGINKTVQIRLADNDIRIDTPRKAIKNGIAYLSGDRKREGVYYGRSIFENIKDVAIQALGGKYFNEHSLMEQFGVKYKSAGQAIETLSGGNQQKVVTARWVGVSPKLLMADDPTKGIDVVARHDVHRIFANLLDEGSSIIMSSSDDDELVKISDVVNNYKVIVMYGGKIVKILEDDEINLTNIINYSMPRGSMNENPQ